MNDPAPWRRTIIWALAGLFLIFGVAVAIKIVYPLRYADTIDRWAAARSLDPYLVASVIRAESRFYPRALSSSGAIGLMQITPTTGQWIAEQMGEKKFVVEDLYEPGQNIRFGTWYLAYLLNRFDGDTESALIAYNAGASNLLRWKAGEGTIFPETKTYLARVKRGWSGYRFLYLLPLLGDLLYAIPL
jgi:soluble lytic murein transglycosylase